MCLSFAVECGWGARGMIYGVAVECEDSKFKFFFVFFYVFQKAKPPQNKKGLRSGTLNRPCCFGVSSSSPENLISELFYSKERKKKKSSRSTLCGYLADRGLPFGMCFSFAVECGWGACGMISGVNHQGFWV